MQAPKIKKCPLCGGATFTIVEVVQVSHHSNLDLTIKCLKCGLRRTITIEMLDKSFYEIIRAIDKAVDDWNRRVENDTDRSCKNA